MNFVDRTADDIAAEARSFIEIDPGGDVGNVRSKAAQRLTDNFSYHGEGKYFAFAADFYPLEFVAGAIATNGSRAKHPGAAVLAFLNHQFAGFGAVPELLIYRGDLRNWLFDYAILIRHINSHLSDRKRSIVKFEIPKTRNPKQIRKIANRIFKFSYFDHLKLFRIS